MVNESSCEDHGFRVSGADGKVIAPRAPFAGPLVSEYRDVSAAGTVGGTCAPITMGAYPSRHLAIPRTTGMPHRPSSSDGQSSVFVFSNPIGRCYRLPKIARRYAGLSLAIGGLGSAAVPTVSHRRRTVRHGFYRIPDHTGSRYRGTTGPRSYSVPDMVPVIFPAVEEVVLHPLCGLFRWACAGVVVNMPPLLQDAS